MMRVNPITGYVILLGVFVALAMVLAISAL